MRNVSKLASIGGAGIEMKPIRLLAIIEAETITGPAKNLLQFSELVRLQETKAPVEVGIVTFVRTGRESNLFVKTAAEGPPLLYTIPENSPFDRSVLPALRRIAEEFRPDIVQSHAVKSHFFLRLAGLHRSAPWVAFHHGYTWPALRARLYNQLDRWSLRAASCVVTMSKPFRDQLIGAGVNSDRIEIVHNAVNPDWGIRCRTNAQALREQLRIPEQAAVALIVGRLSREKDHLTLLRAIQIAGSEGGHRMHLIIVGDGPERPRIEAEMQKLGIADQVLLVGQQPSAEPYYTLANVAVLSSLTEGSPNALLEAMAAGVPAVATSVGGVPEIAKDNESALLVPPGDAQAMANAISRLIAEPTIADTIAANARGIILTRHTPEIRVQRLYNIYKRVLQDRLLTAAHAAADGNY